MRHLKAGDAPSSPERAFGVPSIRSDLPPPKLQKLGEERALGPQLGAGSVLFPAGRKAELGYEQALASPEAAQAFSDRCALGIAPPDVERAYRSAERSSATGCVTVAGYADALRRLGI